MAIDAKDVTPLTQARSRLSEIADEAKAGSEKIITKNGESYVALIDADRLDDYHRLERASTSSSSTKRREGWRTSPRAGSRTPAEPSAD